MNLDYSSFTSGFGNISPPSFSSGEDSNNFDSTDHYIPYSQSSQDSVSSNDLLNRILMQTNNVSPGGGGKNPNLEVRRQKNRESAARSRQKIKSKLCTLEKSMNQLEEKKESLINEKYLISHEVTRLENQMMAMGFEIQKNMSPSSDYSSEDFKEEDLV